MLRSLQIDNQTEEHMTAIYQGMTSMCRDNRFPSDIEEELDGMASYKLGTVTQVTASEEDYGTASIEFQFKDGGITQTSGADLLYWFVPKHMDEDYFQAYNTAMEKEDSEEEEEEELPTRRKRRRRQINIWDPSIPTKNSKTKKV
eukprot:3162373-Ditylum_brightwellii.AAC.1